MCDDSRDLSVSPVLFSSPPYHCSSYSHAHFRRDTTTRRISNKPSTWLLHIDASESTWLLNMQVQTRPQIMPDSARHTTTTPQKSPFGVSGALSWSSVRALCFCRGAQKGHTEKFPWASYSVPCSTSPAFWLACPLACHWSQRSSTKPASWLAAGRGRYRASVAQWGRCCLQFLNISIRLYDGSTDF